MARAFLIVPKTKAGASDFLNETDRAVQRVCILGCERKRLHSLAGGLGAWGTLLVLGSVAPPVAEGASGPADAPLLARRGAQPEHSGAARRHK